LSAESRMSLLTSAATKLMLHRINEAFRNAPKFGVGFPFARVAFDAEDARQDTNDIAVENRRRLIKRDAANCAGGIRTDAGECQHSVEFAREFAVVFAHNDLGRALHVADPGVVAESLPQFVDLIGTGFGERLDIRKRSHPTFPVREDGFYLGLLEHDF